MRMRRLCLILSALPFLLFTSCIKDESTIPVPIRFEFLLKSKLPDEAKKISFREGTLLLADVSFEGYRLEAEDYFFHASFPDTLVCDLASGTTSSPLIFDIPQGIYEHIDFSIQVKSDAQTPAMVLGGTYDSDILGTVNVIFQYTFDEWIDIKVKSEDESDSVVISRDETSVARIFLDTELLFVLVNKKTLEEAEITFVDTLKYIYISDTQNTAIFELVSGRLDKSMELSFY